VTRALGWLGSRVRLLLALQLFLVMGVPAVVGGSLGLRGPVTWIMQRWCRWTLRLIGARCRGHGLEHVPARGGFVMAANHESHIDGVMLVGRVPRPLHVVAKRELFDTPVVGTVFRALDFIPLDRRRRHQARASLSKGTARVRDGEGALIFPEGTRSPEGRLLPFKKGAVIMAIQAQVPLVPVGIAGSYEAFPPGGLDLHPGPVRFRVGPPIPTAGLTLDDRTQVLTALETAVGELRERAHHELGLAP
jgi:1-acyl-sn-glycerol-3-phosphate acyltransferase